MNNWIVNILKEWVPQPCALCGELVSGRICLCTPCRRELPHIHAACLRCGIPLPVQGVCAACQQNPPTVDATVTPLHFQGAARELVHQLKYQQKLYLAPALARLIGGAVRSVNPPKPDLLVAVPVHPRRLHTRGYNQAMELGRCLEKELGIRLERRCVIKTRETPSQSTRTSAVDRRRNLKGAFSVVGEVRGLTVAIVDDVVTTGSTVNELARVLKRAGAARVLVFAGCRADRG